MIRQFCLFLLLLLMVACDKPIQQVKNPPPELKNLSLIMKLNAPENSAEHEGAKFLAKSIAEQTEGTVSIVIQLSDNERNERQLLSDLQTGRLDLALINTAKASHLRTQLELFDLPFVAENPQQMKNLYDSPIAKQLLDGLVEESIVGLAFWYGGSKHLVTDFPLNSLSDLSGRRFKVMESDMLRQQFQQWGASSIPVADAMVKEAFAENLIDGEEETAPHLITHIGDRRIHLTHHGQQSLMLLMSNASFSALDTTQQSVIKDAVRQASEKQFTISVQNNQEAIDSLKRQGLATIPPPSLLADMRAAHRGLLEKNRLTVGTGFVEQFLQLRENWTAPHSDKLIVALDADLTGSAAKSGLAIRRGIELALEEINNQGGLLGKQVALVARDNSMVPSRGLDNIKIFSGFPNLLAVFSGISSPVVLNEIELLHNKKTLMLVPWAAATPITSNGHNPNFIFRVSVRDEYAAKFMLDGALDVSDQIGLLLVNNGWGRSNYTSIMSSMMEKGVQPLHTEWFDWGEKYINDKINNLMDKNIKALIYVGNAVEGEKFINQLSTYPSPPVVISHWGITGSKFGIKTAQALKKVDLRVLQTFSFINNSNPKALALASRYHDLYHTDSAEDILAPSGTAHAYDLMNMLAIATKRAGQADMPTIQKELKKIEHYDGLMKTYKSPFKQEPQDALTDKDYLFAVYQEETLFPLEPVNAK